MKTIIVEIALLLSSTLYAEVANDELLITPGVSVGKVTGDSNETELIKMFGKQNVKSTDIELGEGETAPGTILFPNDPDMKLEILWSDEELKSQPRSVLIKGQHSKWKTKNGISLGTTLKQLEKINGKPFSLAGFGWDGEGTILDFDGGQLCSQGYCDNVERGIIKPRKIYLSILPNINFNDKDFMRFYDQVQGDRRFSSSHPAMQQLNPAVRIISVKFSE